MRLRIRFEVLLVIALVSAAINGPVEASTPLPVPAVAQIEGMCPELGLAGLRFGAIEAEQDAGQLKDLRRPDDRFAPFRDVEIEFTSWSGKLASITFRRAAPEGVSLEKWQAETVDGLVQAGWREVDGSGTIASMASRQLEKRLTLATGERILVVDVDAFGLYAIRCAEREMLDLYLLESEGDLAEGSPRPVRPATSIGFSEIMQRIDCADPVLLERLAGAASLTETGRRIEEHVGYSGDLNPEASYERKLGTWLRWRLRSSGKITQEEMWQIEDSVPMEPADPIVELTDFFDGFSSVVSGQERADPERMCQGFRDMLESLNRSGSAERAHEAALNRRLEEEARRRGISVD
jgi:hypothetical protein